MPTLRSILQADWGPPIQRAAYAITAVAVWCYCAGLLLGEWIHRTNDQLALAISSGRPATLASTPVVPAPVASAPVASAPVASAPVASAPVVPAQPVVRSTRRRRAVGFS